jgi:non-ribosomal peptide synthetase component F
MPGTLGDSFAGTVSRRPESAAIIYGNRTWSYAQLNARSDQLAHLLLRLGVKKGEPGELDVYAGTRVNHTSERHDSHLLTPAIA